MTSNLLVKCSTWFTQVTVDLLFTSNNSDIIVVNPIITIITNSTRYNTDKLVELW